MNLSYFDRAETTLRTEFNKVINSEKRLFRVNADPDNLWDIYSNGFSEQDNPIYRKKRTFDCSECRHFIKSAGKIVWIDRDYHRHSVFDVPLNPSSPFFTVFKKLNEYIVSCEIEGLYFQKESRIGESETHELLKNTSMVKTWNHFSITLPAKSIVDHKKSVKSATADSKLAHDLLKRAFADISKDALETVCDMVSEGVLYRGLEFRTVLYKFRQEKAYYESLSSGNKSEEEIDNYIWLISVAMKDICGIRNTAMGTLLLDISSGEDIETSVKKWESIMAPSNYKRPKAIFTKKMLETAKEKLTELGYMDAFSRRYATENDIPVDKVLYVNRNVRDTKETDIFGELAKEAVVQPKKFENLPTIAIENFVKDILPNCTDVEALVENRFVKNMVSMIAPVNPEAKSLFKWGNTFSWSYTGNLADSDIRENVQKAGGDVNADLRFSIQWNDIPGKPSNNDLDAHCYIRDFDRSVLHEHVYYANRYTQYGLGFLDVDIRHPKLELPDSPAVENIIFKKKNAMRQGIYEFYVNQYDYRGGNDGFRAEIEIDGVTYHYDYREPLYRGDRIHVATVHCSGNHNLTIEHKLKTSESVTSKDIWGIKTNTFVPVKLVTRSPNYWDELHATGNSHYFFFLKDCKNPGSANGFYNEFLKEELMEHKRVLEALGEKASANYSDEQLSGIGFGAAMNESLIVKITDISGKTTIQKIIFK